MGIEDKKSEGGNDVNEEQVKNIVAQVLVGQQEKTQLSQEMGELRKGIKDTNEGLAGLKQLFCSEDGTVCFPTQAELNSYVEKQNKTMETVEAKLTEVVEKVNNMKPPKGELPAGVKVLEPMTEEKRKTFTEAQNAARDAQVTANDKVLNQTSNDRFRQMDEIDRDNIVKKESMRRRFLKTLSPEEIKEAMVIGCKDGKCKVIRGELENTEGYKIYKKDESGRFQPIDQEEKKPLIF